MTSDSKWTPEAIRALGPTTDLPTLGAIFECSRSAQVVRLMAADGGHLWAVRLLPFAAAVVRS